MLKTIFEAMDLDKDDLITANDINTFKKNHQSNLENIVSKFTEENSLSLSELIRAYRDALKVCDNYISFYKTKSKKVEEAINKRMSQINWDVLSITMAVTEKNKIIYDQTEKNINQYSNIYCSPVNYTLIINDHFFDLISKVDYKLRK